MKRTNEKNEMQNVDNHKQGVNRPKETVMKTRLFLFVIALVAISTMAACDFQDDQPSGRNLSDLTVSNNQSTFEATCALRDNLEAVPVNAISSENGSVHSVLFSDIEAGTYVCVLEPTDLTFESLNVEVVLKYEPTAIEVEFNLVNGGTVIPPLVIDLSVDSAAAEALGNKVAELDNAVQADVDAWVCDYEYDMSGINSLRAELPSFELEAHTVGVDHRDRANKAVDEAYEGCGANSDELCTEGSEEIVALRAMAERHFDAIDDSAQADLDAGVALNKMAADQAVCDLPDVVDPVVSTLTVSIFDVGSWIEISSEPVNVTVGTELVCSIAAGDDRICDSVEVTPEELYSIVVHLGDDPSDWTPLSLIEVESLVDGDLPVQITVYEPQP